MRSDLGNLLKALGRLDEAKVGSQCSSTSPPPPPPPGAPVQEVQEVVGHLTASCTSTSAPVLEVEEVVVRRQVCPATGALQTVRSKQMPCHISSRRILVTFRQSGSGA